MERVINLAINHVLLVFREIGYFDYKKIVNKEFLETLPEGCRAAGIQLYRRTKLACHEFVSGVRQILKYPPTNEAGIQDDHKYGFEILIVLCPISQPRQVYLSLNLESILLSTHLPDLIKPPGLYDNLPL